MSDHTEEASSATFTEAEIRCIARLAVYAKDLIPLGMFGGPETWLAISKKLSAVLPDSNEEAEGE